MVELVKPTARYIEGFESFLDENYNANELGEPSYKYMKMNIRKYISQLADYKEMIMYWAIETETNEFLGLINVVNNFDEVKKLYGGSCTYVIKPSKRNQGYGTEMLRLGLEKLKENGFNYALIGSDFDNVSSINIIKKNGGVLQEKVKLDSYNKEILKFRIDL